MTAVDEKHVIVRDLSISTLLLTQLVQELCRGIFSPDTVMEERDLLWNHLRPWLATKSYDLYRFDDRSNFWYPQQCEKTDPDLFFPTMGGDPILQPKTHPLQTILDVLEHLFSYIIQH